ncbi:MAG: D-aminoacyl-tRNA deacylase, partial [Lachnospiraceae bacterium]|nr:D-aminoacyl-tRNA deacylase [Lachnospiraceae bacterium]
MRFVIQRVSKASVKVEERQIGAIEKGFLVFIGVCQEDTKEIADKMIKKLIGLRIFEDEQGKTNLALSDVGGSLLLISQFTLYADCRKGNRPSFIQAGAPDMAKALYEYIIDECKKQIETVEQGE